LFLGDKVQSLLDKAPALGYKDLEKVGAKLFKGTSC